ncbi:HigA family addiction module antitoxin [Dyadobacter sp. SG02]|uniref:HigA family addiction module antitoxin n=1 Tax=Dyadobacter sp. SG02 TaxID=1855291 RepID=UPI000B8446FF|nr:HigA family addiction module antitoxin [Dyadobacter sp. SG02]
MKRGMRPSSPGAILKEIIDGLKDDLGHKLTLTMVAEGLGITRKALSNILHERRPVDAEMCIRLSEAFGMSAEFWRDVQINYDLWQAKRNIDRKAIKRFWPLENEMINEGKA